MLAEPVQRHGSYVRLTAPRVLELRTEGDDEQDRQLQHSSKYQIEELARSRVDPVRVLEHDQDGLATGHGFKLMKQRCEQHLSLALRAEIEIGCRVRQ